MIGAQTAGEIWWSAQEGHTLGRTESGMGKGTRASSVTAGSCSARESRGVTSIIRLTLHGFNGV